ncbi:MAG: hypothetical protein WC011_00735 [Candidatus Paceibacterota bacterium]
MKTQTLNYAQEFYAYLKDKYGVLDTECSDSVSGILNKIIIEIPGFKKNSKEHSISVLLEELSEGGVKRLVIGENNVSSIDVWSRIIEIKNNNDLQSVAWLKIVQNIILGRGYSHENLLLLINIVNEFESLYKERTQT